MEASEAKFPWIHARLPIPKNIHQLQICAVLKTMTFLQKYSGSQIPSVCFKTRELASFSNRQTEDFQSKFRLEDFFFLI